MLATSVRVRPWSCLWTFASDGRLTTILPSSWATAMSGWRSRCRLPRGPSTVIERPSIATVTPSGSWIGSRPIRDIGLPDVRQDFATELGLAGLSAGHDSLARADDDDPETAEDAGNVGLPGVDPEAGLADPLETGYDGRLAVDVLEGQME